MIALLAAVPEETVLIRELLEDPGRESVNGLAMLTGRVYGQDVCLTHGGIGKAAAAAAAITLLQYCQPAALLLFGCGEPTRNPAWRSVTWPSPMPRFSATRELPQLMASLILRP